MSAPSTTVDAVSSPAQDQSTQATANSSSGQQASAVQVSDFPSASDCVQLTGFTKANTNVEHIVDELRAVQDNPEAQHIVQKMAKMAVQGGPSEQHPPQLHPELAAELDKEAARIAAKIEDETVTAEDARHLHSLEVRVHGGVQHGSIAALAQRKVDLLAAAKKAEEEIAPKVEAGEVTKEDARKLVRREMKAHGHIEHGSLAAKAQSVADKHAEHHKAHEAIDPKVETGEVTKEEADKLHRVDARAEGGVEAGSVTAKAQSIADKKENKTSQGAAGKWLSNIDNGNGGGDNSATGKGTGKTDRTKKERYRELKLCHKIWDWGRKKPPPARQ